MYNTKLLYLRADYGRVHDRNNSPYYRSGATEQRWTQMTGTELLTGASPSLQALAVIGIILLEAIILYVGYGAVEAAVGPTVLDRLASK